ncbi:MAG TPA: hypothetical protein VD973_22440, partial [Symbiobacteriaceae bacterium]|nr:hypothetical protein [Symbiobacteriaceae bacterium]
MEQREPKRVSGRSRRRVRPAGGGPRYHTKWILMGSAGLWGALALAGWAGWWSTAALALGAGTVAWWDRQAGRPAQATPSAGRREPGRPGRSAAPEPEAPGKPGRPNAVREEYNTLPPYHPKREPGAAQAAPAKPAAAKSKAPARPAVTEESRPSLLARILAQMPQLPRPQGQAPEAQAPEASAEPTGEPTFPIAEPPSLTEPVSLHEASDVAGSAPEDPVIALWPGAEPEPSPAPIDLAQHIEEPRHSVEGAYPITLEELLPGPAAEPWDEPALVPDAVAPVPDALVLVPDVSAPVPDAPVLVPLVPVLVPLVPVLVPLVPVLV